MSASPVELKSNTPPVNIEATPEFSKRVDILQELCTDLESSLARFSNILIRTRGNTPVDVSAKDAEVPDNLLGRYDLNLNRLTNCNNTLQNYLHELDSLL